MNPAQSFHSHIRDEDSGDAQGHPEHGRYLGYRTPVPAEAQDGLTLRTEDRQVAGLIVGSSHHGFDLKLVPRLSAPAGHRVGTDQSTPRGIRPARALTVQEPVPPASLRPVIPAGPGHQPLLSLPA